MCCTLAGEAWNNLTAQEKHPYEILAEQEKRKYEEVERELKDLKAKNANRVGNALLFKLNTISR